MTPIPHEIGSKLFQGTNLEGSTFPATVTSVDNLIHKRNNIVTPPSERLDLHGLSITMPRLFILEGKSQPANLQAMLENDIVPAWIGQLTPDSPLSRIFGIRLEFDEDPQHIVISRGKNLVKLRHNGLQVPISPGNRNALLGLALLHDSLWPEVAKSGLIVGKIEGSQWDNPWHAHPWSISLPDPHGLLNWRNTEPSVLEDFDVHSLMTAQEPRRQDNEAIALAKKTTEYFQTLKPVGVFLDYRGTI